MNLTFKEKFPELNDNQRRQLRRELLEIIGGPESVLRDETGGLLGHSMKQRLARNRLRVEIRDELYNYMKGDE